MISIHLCSRSYGKNVYYSLSIALVLFCEYAFSFLFSGFQSVPVIINPTERTHRHLPYLYCRKVCRPPLATISTKMAPVSGKDRRCSSELKTQDNVLSSQCHECFIEGQRIFPHSFTQLIFPFRNLVDCKIESFAREQGKPCCFVLVSFKIVSSIELVNIHHCPRHWGE